MDSNNGNRTDDVDRARVERVEATEVHVDRSAVRFVHSEDTRLERSAVQRLRSTTVDAQQSAIGVASFNRGTLRQSSAGVVSGRSMACDEVRAGILIAPVVRGNVHTWLDMRSAVAIGVGIALGRLMIAGARGAVRRVIG